MYINCAFRAAEVDARLATLPDHKQKSCEAHCCTKMADTELQPEQPVADIHTSTSINATSAAPCGLIASFR